MLLGSLGTNEIRFKTKSDQLLPSFLVEKVIIIKIELRILHTEIFLIKLYTPLYNYYKMHQMKIEHVLLKQKEIIVYPIIYY